MATTTALTSAMLQPLVSAITDNIGVVLPIGITIMGIMLGVSLIPKIVYRFF